MIRVRSVPPSDGTPGYVAIVVPGDGEDDPDTAHHLHLDQAERIANDLLRGIRAATGEAEKFKGWL